MAAVGRVGADTVGGGTVITGALSVMTNDLPTVIVGSNVAPHHTHSTTKFVYTYTLPQLKYLNGDAPPGWYFVGGRVRREAVDSPSNQNSQMVVGFPGVLVEDFPICRLGDPSSCGHVLISYSDVEVG